MTVDGATTPAGAIIDVRAVSRSFHAADTTVRAVRAVSLRVAPGEFLALVGRSGSGKTTLLNLIAGLDRPDEGAVWIEGREVSRFSDRELTELRRHTLGFVFQSFGLLPLLSAAENIEIALRIAGAGSAARRRRTAQLLELVGLTARAAHRPYELSGGEQQRVAVARALANEPRVLIADEPTGELDTATGEQIFQLLRDVADRGVAVVTATHDPFVVDHVDRVLELEDGALVAEEHRAADAALQEPPAVAPSEDQPWRMQIPPSGPPRG